MVMRLYLDGCSYTYGAGLPREQSLGHLFRSRGGYHVLDNSSPGKSNMAIAFDAYHHRNEFDIFVLGFTFAARFGLKNRGQDLKFFPGHTAQGFGLDSLDMDRAHLEVQKYFFTVFEEPYCNQLSDHLVDTVCHFLDSKGGTVVAFTWQTRDTEYKLYEPYFGPKDRLADGHLNAAGTEKLFDYLQNILDVTQK